MPRPKRMNGEGSVRKRPDGRYEARVLLQNGRRISVYGKTAREVTREIRAIKVKNDAGAAIVCLLSTQWQLRSGYAPPRESDSAGPTWTSTSVDSPSRRLFNAYVQTPKHLAASVASG